MFEQFFKFFPDFSELNKNGSVRLMETRPYIFKYFEKT